MLFIPARAPIVSHFQASLDVYSSAIDTRSVFGVAKLDGLLYVLTGFPNSIRLYSDPGPRLLQSQIKISRIKLPWDLAASDSDRCLYVTDRGNRCVWKITSPKHRVSKWLSGIGNPYTLSVTADGHVILPRQGFPSYVIIYTSNAVPVRCIQLPADLESPLHAVASSTEKLWLSYGKLYRRTRGICEVTAEGKVVRSYEPEESHQELEDSAGHPCQLSLDPVSDRLFVADYGNNRVILLNSDLSWNQVVVCKTKDGIRQPSRICYDATEMRLIVGHTGEFEGTDGWMKNLRKRVDIFRLI